LLHEFVLRLAAVGVHSKNDIASFLGLEATLVESAIAEQVSSDNVTYLSSSGAVHLTTRGKNAVRELEAIIPVHVQMSVAFDRLTWSVADYNRRDLILKKEASDAGMIIITPSKTSRISATEVPAADLNRVLREREGRNLRREVLAVQQIRPYTHRFLPVKLLVYGNVARSEVEVGLVVEGDLSPQHDQLLNDLGGPEGLGIQIAEPQSRPVLSAELEQIRVPQNDVSDLRVATIDGRLAAASVEAAAISDPTPTSNEEVSLSDISVRSVSVFEHRELLSDALSGAKSRLLIISPWIKSAVVDTSFVERLERRLKAGVSVSIAHGIGPNDKGSDQVALDRLAALQGRFAKSFRFSRLANTHAKVLIYDDKWISTSFNWLSFRGDPDRTYRMEEGTLVQIPGQVTAQYRQYIDLIEEQRRNG
jgi:hypothetical protein